jgi:hypothetical protein
MCGGHQQVLDGQQQRLQLGSRRQAVVAAPRLQPQAAVDLVQPELDRRFRAHAAGRHRAPPQFGPGERAPPI